MPGRPVVTRLAPAGAQAVAIDLDGAPWVVLDALEASRLGLVEGAAPSAAQRREAERLAGEQRALERGARLIGRRSHARGELERKLARRDGPEAAEAAAARLAELGAVDDGRHAALLAERRLNEGWGPARITHDLLAAGVEQELVERTLGGLDASRIEAAARIALGDRTGAEGWRRLAARGFDEELCERLVGLPDGA